MAGPDLGNSYDLLKMDNIKDCGLIPVDLKQHEMDHVHSLVEDTEVSRVQNEDVERMLARSRTTPRMP